MTFFFTFQRLFQAIEDSNRQILRDFPNLPDIIQRTVRTRTCYALKYTYFYFFCLNTPWFKVQRVVQFEADIENGCLSIQRLYSCS